MDITSDISGTGRNLCADRGFSAINIAEELYKKDLTYVGTIMRNRVGLPTRAKDNSILKTRAQHSTEFFWKKDSPVMCLSYKPKKGKNVLLITTEHDQPTIDAGYKTKPEAVLFYNQQRCGVDVVNHMLRDISCQSKSDTWQFAAFTFLLDLSCINAQTILKYNLKNNKICRREFMKTLIFQLVTPWLKHRFNLPNLKVDTKSAITDILRRHAPNFNTAKKPDGKMKEKPARCYICVEIMEAMAKGNERKRKNKNMNRQTWFCPQCKFAVCPKHRAKVPATLEIMCDKCFQVQ